MKKNNIFRILLTLTLFSCNDAILEKQPLDIISDKVLWSDPVLINGFLTEQYALTPVLVQDAIEVKDADPTKGVANQSEQQFGAFFTNSLSDEGKNIWDTYPMSFIYGSLKIAGGCSEYWELPYKTIRSLNEFIDKVPASPLDVAVKKNRIAEARFLRAFNYFAMVKRYGGVPLITKVQNLDDPKEVLFPARDSEQKVYDFIISEMDAIGADLPETYAAADFGRITKYAALSLQCRAALYAGSIAKYGTAQLNGTLGFPSNLASSYFQKSYDAAKTIINSGKFGLYNNDADKVKNFKNIFLVKKNQEVILAKTHNSGAFGAGNPWSWDYGQSPKPHPIDQGNCNAPYLEMAEEFEYVDGTPGKLDYNTIQTGLWTSDDLWKNKDPRFFATIWTINSSWKGTKVDSHNGLILPDGTIITSGSYQGVAAKGNQFVYNNEFGTYFGVMKYLDETVDNSGVSKSNTDYLVFRYAETLLNYAEAAFELGKTTDALDAVNQIRSRAGIANQTTIDMAKIRHERKVELAFENHRYWDLRRWRTATAELSVNRSGLRYILDFITKKYQLQVVKNINGTNVPVKFYDYNYYFPITLNRTGANPSLVENPGY